MIHRSKVNKEMGVYQKLGVRGIAIKLVDAVTWIRHYGFKVGYNIYGSLVKKRKDGFVIQNDLFKSPVYLRDNFSDKAIFKQVFYDRQYLLDQLLNFDAKYIVDAGANIGLAAIYFSQLFPSAQIIAIEPQNENFELLKKNTSACTNIKIENAALWYKEEKIDIVNPDSLSASFMVGARENASIEAVTVPSLLKRYNWTAVDILKIDIEGAEKEIFSNDVSWLKNIRLLIIELHDSYKRDCTKTFFRAIENFNYEAIFRHENIFVFFN
jgi:FkbM family methyltransferase